MKSNLKIFIFEMCNASLPTFSDAQLKTFREPRIGIGYGKLANVISDFNAGLFICLCFQILRNSIIYSGPDKGACNRYTSMFPIVGSCKSGCHNSEENNDSLFAGTFSLFLLFFSVVGSAFLFFAFSFKLLLTNHHYEKINPKKSRR